MDDRFMDDKFPDIPLPEIMYQGFFMEERIDEEHGVTLESLRAKDKKFIRLFLFLTCWLPVGVLVLALLVRMIH